MATALRGGCSSELERLRVGLSSRVGVSVRAKAATGGKDDTYQCWKRKIPEGHLVLPSSTSWRAGSESCALRNSTELQGSHVEDSDERPKPA